MRTAVYDKPYSVRLTTDMHAAIDQTARRLRTTQQEIVRVAVGLGLRHLNGQLSPIAANSEEVERNDGDE